VPVDLLPQSQISVADVSSQETDQADNAASNALDGDPATFWHTDWDLTEGPHWITLDLGDTYKVQALRYRPRPGAGNGTMKEYEVYLSEDGKAWGEPVATGSLEPGTEPSVIELPGAEGRYLKVVYLSSYSDAGRHFASATGFNVQGAVPGRPVVQSVADVQDITVPLGTPKVEALAQLAGTTTLTDTSGGTHEVDLTWTSPDYRAAQAGQYEATAEFDLPEGVAPAPTPRAADAREDLTATITVEQAGGSQESGDEGDPEGSGTGAAPPGPSGPEAALPESPGMEDETRSEESDASHEGRPVTSESVDGEGLA